VVRILNYAPYGLIPLVIPPLAIDFPIPRHIDLSSFINRPG